MIFYLTLYSNFFSLYFFHLIFLIIVSHIVLFSILTLLNKSLKSNICADSLRRLILHCSSLSSILTLSPKGRVSLFFPYMVCHTRFVYFTLYYSFPMFFKLIFSEQYVSLLYTLSLP